MLTTQSIHNIADQLETCIPRNYGYIRRSSNEGNTSDQLKILRRAGISEDLIFTDIVNNIRSDCPAYQELLKTMKPGDTLFVTKMDRLGNSCDDIVNQWRTITKDLACNLVVLNMPLLDTRRGEDISDLVIQIFHSFSEIGSNYRRQCQAEGIAKARANDIAFGRPAKTRPENFDYIAGLYDRRLISSRDAAERLNVSQKTFLKWFHEVHCM